MKKLDKKHLSNYTKVIQPKTGKATTETCQNHEVSVAPEITSGLLDPDIETEVVTITIKKPDGYVETKKTPPLVAGLLDPTAMSLLIEAIQQVRTDSIKGGKDD